LESGGNSSSDMVIWNGWSDVQQAEEERQQAEKEVEKAERELAVAYAECIADDPVKICDSAAGPEGRELYDKYIVSR
jgi:hypothetical protein